MTGSLQKSYLLSNVKPDTILSINGVNVSYTLVFSFEVTKLLLDVKINIVMTRFWTNFYQSSNFSQETVNNQYRFGNISCHSDVSICNELWRRWSFHLGIMLQDDRYLRIGTKSFREPIAYLLFNLHIIRKVLNQRQNTSSYFYTANMNDPALFILQYF
jgi:hypothetical protein